MKATLDTKLGEILGDPQAKAVLDQFMPGASKHPMIGLAKGMSLRSILMMPQAKQLGLTEEKVKEMLAEINKAA
jgi:hypothetical protein